ncbi:hypothetical protein RFI_04231 [Reticulomyxa filosa]|uniref:Rab-GAP TBC domain-containing protein n=1 Tax=Reticulomyxa filosa TaxID=46433 RepID=X6P5L3_RETFI|nr:hypothetical protein RFI_04231 [Reticulomyxa filosa]|eukprot:ETO32882.1 hypothetical protein RFI_04231 [Reticulomyxa filosa]
MLKIIETSKGYDKKKVDNYLTKMLSAWHSMLSLQQIPVVKIHKPCVSHTVADAVSTRNIRKGTTSTTSNWTEKGISDRASVSTYSVYSECQEEELNSKKQLVKEVDELEQEKEQEQEHEALWKELLYKWKKIQREEKRARKGSKEKEQILSKFEELHRCARSLVGKQQIPASIRGQAWFIISGAFERMKSYPKHYYHSLWSKSVCNRKVTRDISKDITRTFSLLKVGATQTIFEEKLRRVLVAYANFDCDLGYCQGMNYIAAFLLNEFDSEEEAFWTFCTILMDKKYYARALFIGQLPGYVKCEKVLNELLKYNLPEIHQHFESLECMGAVLSPWLHCMFTYPNVDFKITCFIWDSFFIQGFVILIKISYVICLVHFHKFVQFDFADIVKFCKTKHVLNSLVVRTYKHTKINSHLLNTCQSLYNPSFPLLDRLLCNQPHSP